jgi:hypothetical protein
LPKATQCLDQQPPAERPAHTVGLRAVCAVGQGQRRLHGDIAGVELFIHEVDRHAGSGLAVAEGPEQRRRAAMGRQQRWVDIQPAEWWQP